jgi:hypothetical protein
MDIGNFVNISRYIPVIMTPGSFVDGVTTDRGDRGYRPESQRRAAALFANGGFVPFLKATTAIALNALKLTTLLPGNTSDSAPPLVEGDFTLSQSCLS